MTSLKDAMQSICTENMQSEFTELEAKQARWIRSHPSIFHKETKSVFQLINNLKKAKLFSLIVNLFYVSLILITIEKYIDIF